MDFHVVELVALDVLNVLKRYCDLNLPSLLKDLSVREQSYVL
jgi:hypothetical protein